MATPQGPGYLFARAWYGIDVSKAASIPLQELTCLPDDEIGAAFLSYLEAEVAKDNTQVALAQAYAELARAHEARGPTEGKSLDELFEDLSCTNPNAIPWHIDARRRLSRLAQLLKATGLLVPHGVALQEKGHKGARLGPTKRVWLGKLKDMATALEAIKALAGLLDDGAHPILALAVVPSSELDVATRYLVETEIRELASSPARSRPSRSDPGYTEACVGESLRQAAVHVAKFEEFIAAETQPVGSRPISAAQARVPVDRDPATLKGGEGEAVQVDGAWQEPEARQGRRSANPAPESVPEARAWLVTRVRLLKVLGLAGVDELASAIKEHGPKKAWAAPKGSGQSSRYELGVLYDFIMSNHAKPERVPTLRLNSDLLAILEPPTVVADLAKKSGPRKSTTKRSKAHPKPKKPF